MRMRDKIEGGEGYRKWADVNHASFLGLESSARAFLEKGRAFHHLPRHWP